MILTEELKALKSDVESLVNSVPEDEWEDFADKATRLTVKKNRVIFPQQEICRKIIFLVEGVTASECVVDDRSTITRFFLPGNFCTNIVSAFTSQPGPDKVFSITAVDALCFSVDRFMKYFHGNSAISRYIREKFLQTIIEDKRIFSSKTLLTSDGLDKFLREIFPEIIRQVPGKYIAKFMGITPEAYSRLLKRRLQKS